MYVLNKNTKDPSVVRFQSTPGKARWLFRNFRRARLKLSLARYARSAPKDRTFYVEDRTPFYKDACQQIPNGDLINLHWVANFIDLGAFLNGCHPTSL